MRNESGLILSAKNKVKYPYIFCFSRYSLFLERELVSCRACDGAQPL
jgi:hypothetical protein